MVTVFTIPTCSRTAAVVHDMRDRVSYVLLLYDESISDVPHKCVIYSITVYRNLYLEDVAACVLSSSCLVLFKCWMVASERRITRSSGVAEIALAVNHILPKTRFPGNIFVSYNMGLALVNLTQLAPRFCRVV